MVSKSPFFTLSSPRHQPPRRFWWARAKGAAKAQHVLVRRTVLSLLVDRLSACSQNHASRQRVQEDPSGHGWLLRLGLIHLDYSMMPYGRSGLGTRNAPPRNASRRLRSGPGIAVRSRLNARDPFLLGK